MKLFVLSSLAGAALILVAAHVPDSLLDKQASVLKAAKTLKVSFTYQHVPGTRADYTLTFSKPNLFSIDGPDHQMESDGKTLWDYDKTAKTYSEAPVTPALLAKATQASQVLAWASFFSDDLVKNASDVKTGASRSIKGEPATEVTFTLGTAEPKSVTLFVGDKQGVARGSSIKDSSGQVLVLASKVEIGDSPMTADQFTFAAPAGVTKTEAPAATEGLGWASVQPVFANNCGGCHGGSRGRAGFSVATYQSVMKGSEDGPVITPGDPDGSLLVKLITGQANPKMPPGGRSVSSEDIAKIKAWIKAGAKE